MYGMWRCQVYFRMMIEMHSSASKHWLPYRDKAKCGGGLWHFHHLWMEGHCFKMWLGLTQLVQYPFCFRKVTICSCGKLLNFLQAYKGWRASLQTTHRSSTLTVYDCVCGEHFLSAVGVRRLWSNSRTAFSDTCALKSRNSNRALWSWTSFES